MVNHPVVELTSEASWSLVRVASFFVFTVRLTVYRSKTNSHHTGRRPLLNSSLFFRYRQWIPFVLVSNMLAGRGLPFHHTLSCTDTQRPGTTVEDCCTGYRGVEGESTQARALESFPQQGTLSSTWCPALQSRGEIIDSLTPGQSLTPITVRCYGRGTWTGGTCCI